MSPVEVKQSPEGNPYHLAYVDRINEIVDALRGRIGNAGIRIHAYHAMDYTDNGDGTYDGEDSELQFQTERGIALFQFV
jgi:hypothetical protein